MPLSESQHDTGFRLDAHFIAIWSLVPTASRKRIPPPLIQSIRRGIPLHLQRTVAWVQDRVEADNSQIKPVLADGAVFEESSVETWMADHARVLCVCIHAYVHDTAHERTGISKYTQVLVPSRQAG